MSTIVGSVVQALAPVILKELLNSNIPVNRADAPLIATRAAQAAAPMVVNKANAEPWYQSRVTIGALISIGTGLLALFGIVLTPEDTALIVSLCTSLGAVVAGGLTLYGRWKAKKPIGQ